MARPIKKGFEYFPCDVNLPNDIKIRRLIKQKGGGAVWVYLCALSLIYKGGYYMDYDSDTPFVLSEITGFNEDYINGVIDACLKLNLFSKEVFEKQRVLTSTGIQRRYIAICQSSKRKFILDKYALVSSEETLVNSEETKNNYEEIVVSSEETLVNSEFSTQSKVKKSKVKEREGMQNKELILPLHPTLDLERVVNDYNNAVKEFAPTVKRLTKNRKDKLLEIFREMKYDYTVFEIIFEKIKGSKFFAGDNPRRWTITFEWLITSDNWVKVYEGNYDNSIKTEDLNKRINKIWT